MEITDIVMTIVNVGITAVSLYGSYNSVKYYKKSKNLAAHTNINKALVEIEKMLNKLPEALTAVNKARQNARGTNIQKIICDIGNDLIQSYNEIRSCIPAEYASALFSLENEKQFELQKYINGYISGDALENNKLNSNDYASCQNCLMAMQSHLKSKLDDVAEKLK